MSPSMSVRERSLNRQIRQVFVRCKKICVWSSWSRPSRCQARQNRGDPASQWTPRSGGSHPTPSTPTDSRPRPTSERPRRDCPRCSHRKHSGARGRHKIVTSSCETIDDHSSEEFEPPRIPHPEHADAAACDSTDHKKGHDDSDSHCSGDQPAALQLVSILHHVQIGQEGETDESEKNAGARPRHANGGETRKKARA